MVAITFLNGIYNQLEPKISSNGSLAIACIRIFVFDFDTILFGKNNPIVQKQENDCSKNHLCNNDLAFLFFGILFPFCRRHFGCFLYVLFRIIRWDF